MVASRKLFKFSLAFLFWVLTIACLSTVIFVQRDENYRLRVRMQALSQNELTSSRTLIDIQVNSELLVATDKLGVLSIKVATSSAHVICLAGDVISESSKDISSDDETSLTLVVAWPASDGQQNLTVSCGKFHQTFTFKSSASISLQELLPEYGLRGVYSDSMGVQAETMLSVSDIPLTLSFKRSF